MIKKKYNVDISPYSITAMKKKYRVSSIKPSYSRVAKFNPHADWIERQYLRSVFEAHNKYDHSCIINADETNCRTFPHTITKVYGYTNHGREGRKVNVDNDVKQGITCMVSITAAGNVLLPLFIKKGTTDRCIKQIQNESIMATYSENGWMNENVAIEYVNKIIIPHLNGRKGCIIWDIFKAHLTPAVQAHLKENNIEPIYVPASLTWKRQPLDTHIFSVIKKKYQKYYFEQVFHLKNTITQIDTIKTYTSLIQSISPDLILSAFNGAILYDAKLAPSIEMDPNPNVESIDSTNENDEDEIIVEQYEDEKIEEIEELSEDEIPEYVPLYRHPRQSQIESYNHRLAQNFQSSILRSV